MIPLRDSKLDCGLFVVSSFSTRRDVGMLGLLEKGTNQNHEKEMRKSLTQLRCQMLALCM